MAHIDALNEIADAVALGAATGRRVVGSQIDLGTTVRNIGVGKPVWVVIRVDTAFTSGGATDVTFELVSDSTAALATDGSSSIHYASAAIPKATLVAGYQIVIQLPQGSPAYERYLGLVANVATTALDTGKVDCFLTYDQPEAWKSYADASN